MTMGDTRECHDLSGWWNVVFCGESQPTPRGGNAHYCIGQVRVRRWGCMLQGGNSCRSRCGGEHSSGIGGVHPPRFHKKSSDGRQQL